MIERRAPGTANRAHRAELARIAEKLVVTVSDVAELVDRPPWAVTQWRKRVSDPFPEPISAGRSPQFNAGEVLAWLRVNEGLGEDRPSASWYWRHAVALLPAATDPTQRPHLRGYVAALVALGAALHDVGRSTNTRQLALGASSASLVAAAERVEQQRSEWDGLLATRLAMVDPDPDVLGTLTRTIDLVLEAASQRSQSKLPVSAKLFDDGLTALAELAPDAAASHPLLVDLASAITSSWPGATVLDPACGEAMLLARVDSDRRPRLLVGIERDPQVAGTARTRLALRGSTAEIIYADALRGADLVDHSVDIVLLDPPTGGSAAGLGSWLALVTRVLALGGRAAVAMPAASLRASASAAELLHRRRVAAVVLLPPTVRHAARDTQSLTIIGSAGQHEQILVADLRPVRPSRSVRPAEHARQFNGVAHLIDAWLADPDADGADLPAFRDRTGIRAEIVGAAEALVSGVTTVSTTAPSPEIADAVANLQGLLAGGRDLPGADRLDKALRSFARANGLPDLAP